MSIGRRLIMACLVIMGLAGCAAKSIRNDFTLGKEQAEGIVVLSVSHDLAGPRGTKAIFYMDGGAAHGGSMLFSVDDVIPGISRSGEFEDSRGHLLVLALPPGRHIIDYWQITNGSGLRIFPKEKPKPLEFEVTSGKVKYLGNLHANLQTGKNIFGITITGNGYPEVVDRQTRDIPMFEDKYPQFKGKVALDLLPLGPWIQSSETRKQTDVIVLPTTK